ncbi:MAG: hypothetical protein M0Q13_07535 [Methanothrix sp.]|jgi:hypothetical protein|nr:hypothetical protein [Methanothrix sp.]
MRPLLQPANNGAGANRLNRALLLGYGLGSAIIGKGKTTWRHLLRIHKRQETMP